MADIRPFRGLRPRPDLAAEIAAPPYDVLDSEEALELIRQHPRSFMRVIRPDAELTDLDRFDARVFAAGKRNLQALVDEDAMRRDETPCLYLYELSLGQHVQAGLVAGASLKEYDEGHIKRHEKTRRPELEGRTRHIEALDAHTGPAFLTYRARPEIDAYTDNLRQRSPDNDFTADDSVRHRFWVIDDPSEISRLQQLLDAVPSLYVADGHHRTAASNEVRKRRREQLGLSEGVEHASDHYLAVLFPHDQLRILAYNRVILDLAGHSPQALIEAISERFAVTPTDQPLPERPQTFCMVLDHRWYRLDARPGSFAAADPLQSLDVSILQHNLIEPIMGIEHPRTDPRIEFVGGVRGTAELERRAAARNGVAFSLYPVAIEQVMDVADRGEVMPPKSTWFEPKLRSGLVVRLLDDLEGV